MTDPELIAKRLAFIETLLRELREQGRPEHIEADVRERRFTEHTLQLAIQAALDVASHIVSDERLGEPRTQRELFDLLAEHGFVEEAQREPLRRMAGFRNVLVHGYTEVDPSIVRDVAEHHLQDLEAFVQAIRKRLP